MLGFAFALLTGAAAAPAATYDLNLELTVGDHSPAKARVRVAPGKPASFIKDLDGESVFVDVNAEEGRPSEPGEKGVVLRFVVGTLGDKKERHVLARPTIKALEDERALLSENHVSIAVTAKPL